MERKLHQIVLPSEAKLQTQWGMFYRGPRCVMNDGCNELDIPQSHVIDFVTFFNGFSNAKWKKYTNIQATRVHAFLKGKFKIAFVGYKLNPFQPERTIFDIQEYDFDEIKEIIYDYPDNDEQLIAFEIHPLSNCVFAGGYYSGEFAESDVRNVDLVLATTTCFKEPFIKHNIQLLNEEIFNCDEEIAEHFNVHVIDNGRTLNPEEFNSEKLIVHPNKNVGGSGGFARGMYEALHQDKPATHVLLMDDDVVIMPESIKKTYRLLTVLKKEYQGQFIAGAMMALEDMCIMHEDLGTIRDNGEVCPRNRDRNVTDLVHVLICDQELPKFKRQFGAWWYCCMPLDAIRENGLPLPIFIRSDDLEYGLRCNPGFITMNGICLWHMGFSNKYSPSVDMYQVYRNMLIIKATTGVCSDVDFMSQIKRMFRTELLKHNYKAAELLVMAVEDYLKGPEFLYDSARAEEIFMGNRAYNEKLIPISEFKDERFPDLHIRLDEVYFEPPRKRWDTFKYRLTYNGQRFCPKGWLKDEPAVIGYDWSYQPQKMAMRKYLIIVNITNQTMGVRELDQDKFKEIMKRYKKVMKAYKANNDKIMKAYADKREYLTSEEFWEKYLGI